jgi:hypothetical protein
MQGHTATVRHRLGEPTVRVLVVAVLALLAATTGAGGAVAADPPPGWVAAEVEPVVLWAGEATEVPDVLAPAGRASAVTATFQVNWTGAPPTAVRDAVAEATRLWSTQVVSSVPIRIDASWSVLEPGALAGAGPSQVYRDFPGAPAPGTWFPDALVDATVGYQVDPSTPDMEMVVSSQAPWFTGLSGGSPSNQYDLVTVAFHEIGHGLGFGATFDDRGDGRAGWGLGGYPYAFDRAVETAAGGRVVDLPNPSSSALSAVTSGNLWLDMPTVAAATGGARARLFAPNPFEPGSSVAHLDEATHPAGTTNALMTPYLGGGETIHLPGPLALAVLDGIGWDLAPPPVAPGAPAIVASGPGDGAASVTWVAPASDGGSPITAYTVEAAPSGRSVTVVGSRRSATLTGLTNGVAEDLTVTATNAVGVGPPSEPVAVTPVGGTPTGVPGYHPLVPARILDTRTGVGGPASRVGPATVRTLDVTDTAGSGVPSTGVRAVVLNVTATASSGDSDVRLWPTGSAQPAASNLNIRAGATVPNLVTVGVGAGGTVQIRNQSGTVDLIADVVGWFDDGTTLGVPFTALTPTRILDTRKGIGGPQAKVGTKATRTLDVTATLGSGVPAVGVSAVLLNVTATGATADTFVTAFPTGAARPQASNLNVTPARSIANLVAVAVGPSGTVDLYNSAGQVDLVADVVGWYGPGAESVFTPVDPTRRFDTRTGTLAGGPFTSGETRSVEVVGVNGIPASATAVVINVTATNVGNDTFVTVWPDQVARPGTSNLNVSAGWTLANLVVARVGANGGLSVFDNTGPTDILGDVVGWYGPPA